MRCNLAIVAVLLAPSLAFAQAAPDEPSPTEPTPPEKPPEPEPGPVVEAKPEPIIAPVETGSSSHVSRSHDTPHPEIVFGLEVGVGGTLSGGVGYYHPGFGRSLFVGAKYGALSIEWHFDEGFDARADASLRASNTGNELGMMSLGLRVEVTPFLSIYGGIARASIPILAQMQDPGNPSVVTVHSDQIDGIGPIAGAFLGYSSEHVVFGVEGRLAKIVTTDATDTYVITTGPTVGTETPVMATQDDLHPVIGTLCATLRIHL